MAAQHPLAPLVLPACKRFPAQSAALFQATVDLALAQQWKDVRVVEIDECGCAVIQGRPPRTPSQAPPAFVYPMGLQQPTSLRQLTSVLHAIASRLPASPDSSNRAPSPSDDSSILASTVSTTTTSSPSAPTTIYLAMIEKDSSIVYYVLRDGIVSPKEVPE